MAPASQPPHRVRQEIDALSQADLLRLNRSARYFAVGTEYQPDDLIQEALRRSLDGDRKWPAQVPFLTFLRNAMKSIAWADREQQKRRPELRPLPDEYGHTRSHRQFAVPDEHDDSAPPLAPEFHVPPDEAVDPEGTEPGNTLIDRVFEMFDDDDDAFTLLTDLADGMTAGKIRSQEGWDQTAYDTIRRRVRRKINKAIEEGRLDGTQR